jgi:hypothetical protein
MRERASAGYGVFVDDDNDGFNRIMVVFRW